MKARELRNGVLLPAVGLGTWRSPSEDAYNAVLSALENGYTHIDTAMIYGNEEAIGKAIKDSGKKREDVFVTTKLWNSDQGYESTKAAFELSLKKLGMDYVDLYLVHWFKGYENLSASWKAIEELYEAGKIKAIGVSNFNVHHLMYLLENAKVKPMVNQVETHIELQNQFLLEFCENNGIVMEAYAPLMSSHIQDMLQNEVMIEIAEKHNKTVPQVAIAWLMSRGIVPLPKSVNPERIKSNFNVFDFELDKEDLVRIKGLNKGRKFFPEYDNVMF